MLFHVCSLIMDPSQPCQLSDNWACYRLQLTVHVSLVSVPCALKHVVVHHVLKNQLNRFIKLLTTQ